jgi:hypothetical protein
VDEFWREGVEASGASAFIRSMKLDAFGYIPDVLLALVEFSLE